MTLAEFLRARLDDDEQIANGAVRWSEGAREWSAVGEPDWTHIARHDPVRVLADVAAKRRIIDEHHVWDQPGGYGFPDVACAVCVTMVMDEDAGGNRFLDLEHEVWPCPTLRLLALPYRDHPDYQPGWAP